MITRRTILIACGAGAIAATLPALAQQTKVWRVGFLWEVEPSYYSERLAGFKAGMSALGYSESTDYVIEQRSAQSELGRLPALAAELVTLKVDMIVTSGTPSVIAASKSTPKFRC